MAEMGGSSCPPGGVVAVISTVELAVTTSTFIHGTVGWATSDSMTVAPASKLHLTPALTGHVRSGATGTWSDVVGHTATPAMRPNDGAVWSSSDP
jgi:hypothetical protein